MSDAGNPVGDGGTVMRVRGAQETLVLAARAAARALRRPSFRFTLRGLLPRRVPVSPPSAWTPLLLRWARKALALRSGRAARAPAAPAPVAWFHRRFHLAARSGAGRAPHAARMAAAAGPLQVHAGANRVDSAGAGRAGVEPSAGNAGWLPGEALSRRAQPVNAGPAQSFGQAGAAGPRASREVPAALRPARRSAGAQTPAGARDFWRQTPSEVLGPLRWPKRMQGAAHGLDAARTPAAGRMPGDQALRASGAAVTATQAARRGAAPGTPVEAVPQAFLRPARTRLARTAPWPQRGQGAARAFDAQDRAAVRRAPGEQAWRASERATAVRPAGRSAAARMVPGIGIGIGMGRPVDLVWPAGPAAASAPAASPRFGSAPAAGAPSAPSTQAGAAAPAASHRSGNDSVVRATALDPVLASRLADEVMRRIDHRARIERERRGL